MTLTRGLEIPIHFTSEPSGATVWIDSIASGTTPVILNLRRKSSHNVWFSKQGFARRTLQLEMEFEWKWVAIEYLPLWPLLVDLVYGAMYNLDYSYVHGVLMKE